MINKMVFIDNEFLLILDENDKTSDGLDFSTSDIKAIKQASVAIDVKAVSRTFSHIKSSKKIPYQINKSMVIFDLDCRKEGYELRLKFIDQVLLKFTGLDLSFYQ